MERWRRTVAAGSLLLGMAGAPLAQETLPRVGPEVGQHQARALVERLLAAR